MSSVQNENPQCKSKDSRTFKSSLIQVNQYKEKKEKMVWEVYLNKIRNIDRCKWEHKISHIICVFHFLILISFSKIRLILTFSNLLFIIDSFPIKIIFMIISFSLL